MRVRERGVLAFGAESFSTLLPRPSLRLRRERFEEDARKPSISRQRTFAREGSLDGFSSAFHVRHGPCTHGSSPERAVVMASTLLEQTREAHEECERLERFIVSDLKTEAITHKQRLRQGHRVNRALDAIAANAKRLRATYADADRARAEELASFGTLETKLGASDPGNDEHDELPKLDSSSAFASFYARLEETRSYHDARPGTFAPPPDAFVRTFEEDVPLKFSGEEANGRFLDLHAHHSLYRNAPFGETNCSYVAFLADVGAAQMRAIPRAKKFSAAYAEYLESLRAYLEDFFAKVAPLRFAETLKNPDEAFDAAWREGAVAGWEDRGVEFGKRSGLSSRLGEMDVETRTDTETLSVGGVLEELRGASSPEEVSRRVRGDPEAVKARLAALGLKVGGTEAQRLSRLFEVSALEASVRDQRTWPEGVPSKLLAKGAAAAAADPARAEKRARRVAFLESAVVSLFDRLRGTLDATKAQVEKKQTLSAAELEADNEEDSDFIASESDDDDAGNDPVNNPLRLPLGFDGKPIPYWLYKLHGLNLEFTCEICGNYSYWGRRAYERHFKEARHQHGMRCLNIPNTKAFAEVRAKSQDAKVVFPGPPRTRRSRETSFFFWRTKSVFSRIWA